jgi:hypothetical protein
LKKGQLVEVTLDTGAAYSLADCGFIREHFLDAEWVALPRPISTGGVGTDKVISNEAVYVTLYVPS